MSRNWWLLLHLVGVFGFLMAHGVSIVVLFLVRKERDRNRIRELLQLSGQTVLPMYVSLAVVIGAGFVLAVRFWSVTHKFILWSIAILVVTFLAMLYMARPYYRAIKDWVALRPSGVPRVSDEDLSARLTSARPVWVAVIGFAGLLAILYLMVFKPI